MDPHVWIFLGMKPKKKINPKNFLKFDYAHFGKFILMFSHNFQSGPVHRTFTS